MGDRAAQAGSPICPHLPENAMKVHQQNLRRKNEAPQGNPGLNKGRGRQNSTRRSENHRLCEGLSRAPRCERQRLEWVTRSSMNRFSTAFRTDPPASSCDRVKQILHEGP